jgi:copper transport protein
VRRLLVSSAAVLALTGPSIASLGAFAGPAAAHASIERTTPADGELLDAPPSELTLAFTEPPDLSLTVVRLLDAQGAEVAAGEPEAVPGADREISLALGEIPDGVYTVTWRTVSSTDGHVTAGSFSFGVGVSPTDVSAPVSEATATAPPPSALSIAGRLMLYVGLAVLFAAGVTGLLALGTGVTSRGWALGVAWIASAAGVVAMTLAERSAVEVSLGTLLASDAGGAFVRLAVAVAVAALTVVLAWRRPGRATLIALAAGAGVAMLTRAAGGHAGGSVGPVLVQWFHLMGVGVWIGGLVWLVLGLRRGLDPAQVRRFSNLAAGGLLIVFASGVLRASNELGGPTWFLDAFDTDYGTVLVVKLGLVALLVGLGALNRFRNVPAYPSGGTRPLLRAVGGELALAVGVFALTGTLTGLPPQGDGPTGPPPTRSLAVMGSDFGTTTEVTLRISPGTVGPNSFLATVVDFDTGEPVDARRVSLSFSVPDRPDVGSTLELQPRPDGTWRAEGTALSIDGAWEIVVLIELAGGSVEVPLALVPRSAHARVELSRSEGQPDLYTISLPSGERMQCYLDPGAPGTNQLHLTAFDPSGAELALASAVVRAQGPAGRIEGTEPVRLGPGHFVVNLELSEGAWTFDASGWTGDGDAIAVAFAVNVSA